MPVRTRCQDRSLTTCTHTPVAPVRYQGGQSGDQRHAEEQEDGGLGVLVQEAQEVPSVKHAQIGQDRIAWSSSQSECCQASLPRIFERARGQQEGHDGKGWGQNAGTATAQNAMLESLVERSRPAVSEAVLKSRFASLASQSVSGIAAE